MARKIAGKTRAPTELSAAIDGAAGLAKQGLTEARDAVRALRRDDRLGVDQLPELVEHFRRDFGLAVTDTVEGRPRPVTPEVGMALYRATGEALTNVARHAAGASTRVELRFDEEQVRLAVSNGKGSAARWPRAAAGDWRASASGSSASVMSWQPGRGERAGRSPSACRHDGR